MGKFNLALPFMFCVLSFVVVLLAFKSPLPLNHRADGSLEAFQVELGGLFKEEFQGPLRFPFPCVVPSADNQKVQQVHEEKVLPSVNFVYLGKEKYVLIGEELLKEGDKWGRWKVKAITLSGVMLEDEKGERRWVSLEE